MPRLIHGDCLVELPKLAADGVRFDSVVTDPPYELGFMGRKWDSTGIAARPETWRAVFDTMKPGAHLVAFGGTRTYHRMVCAIEDAGFEVRDCLSWMYGSGFPKSHDVSKGIDRAAGAAREKVAPRSVINHQRGIGNVRPYMLDPDHKTDSDVPATQEAAQWQGWGTALKPAMELICLARKPLIGTVVATVLKHGTGAINIDGCRAAGAKPDTTRGTNGRQSSYSLGAQGRIVDDGAGRWPANVLHDGSPEVLAAFAAFGDASGQQRRVGPEHGEKLSKGIYGDFGEHGLHEPRGETGTAARFFYTAKADAADRADSKHPTVKPIDLMRWLVRLVTPLGGHILDCFAGSGTTGEAATLEGFDCTMIERDDQYAADIRHRIARWSGLDAPLFADVAD